MSERINESAEYIPDRRVTDKGLGGTVLTMQERLNRGDERMGKLEKDLAANTAATNEVLEIVRMGKSFFKVAGHIGSITKWVLTMCAAVGAVYAAWTHAIQK